ncbi:DUF3810 domain-containing protein [Mucilaginibacter sp. 14171R-50]|uniref:DUF3810 domain-containing protein n=1 Tax=Mucilaginibacter sp. 14171R-50 TaxID=2703789 RepID=UPI00138B384A|nr:DUF3810 domain-containing protein [Mucilaginibacter sp. 14171R-50]QHS55699.1 DUF3810 domain-containing protein [Mucilaginibacter sp. 14171R-50]
MRNQSGKKVLIKRGIIILSLIFAIYLLMLFAGHPHAVERYYSRGIYSFLCRVLHPLFNLFPFSVGDVVYAAVIIYLVYALIRLIALCIKKRFLQAGIFTTGVVIGVQVSILVFYLFWGMNYFRPSAAERLNLRDSTFTKAELQKVTTILIDSANASRARVTPADLKQSNDSIYKIAVRAVLKLSGSSNHYKTYSPGIKPSLLTPLLNYISTSGYYNPFTGEAQINYQMPVFNRPFVACHEMSHQMGYGPEDEANFAGFMAATSSGDRLLRYSAYNLAVNEFMHTVRYTDTIMFKQLKTRISPAVLADFKEERLYWLSYQNKLETLTSIFYDNFLKANNQPEGLAAYNRMVLLIMAMYRKP